MPKRLNKKQRAEMLELISAVNSEQVSKCEEARELNYPEWFLDWPLYSAGENMPGYMPDSPYCLFLTDRSARGYCRELESSWEDDSYVTDIIPTTLREILI